LPALKTTLRSPDARLDLTPAKAFRLCVLGLTALLLSPALTSNVCAAAVEAAATTSATQAGEAPADSVSFFSKKTRLWTGRSQIICFQVAQPAIEDRYYSFQVDEKLIHLLVPPRILQDEKIGYLRVQPLVEGKTRIGIEGAKLDVEIVNDTSAAAVA
jgi:hypothetical protein